MLVIDNDNRVQGSFVSQPRDRWFIRVVLLLAVVAFIGFSILPILSTALKESQPSTATTPAGKTATAGQSQLAEQAQGYELVLQREPENQTALKGLVEAKIALRDIKGAIAPLEKLAALNSEETSYTLLLAQAKQQVGDREGAANSYRSILATQPGELQALQGLTGLLLEQNQPEAAINLLQDTASIASESNQVDVAAVQLLLGEVYAFQKRYDEAIAIYDRAIVADKQDFRPLLAKAIVFKQQGKTLEAKSLFTNAAALAPAQYKQQINSLATKAPAVNTASPTPAPTK